MTTGTEGGSGTGTGGSGAARKPGLRNQRGARPYRKHRPLPALALITVLGVLTAVLWLTVAMDKSSIDDEIRCEPAPAAQAGVTFTPLPHGALRGTAPLPPAQVQAQVLNAGSVLGQAGRTTEKLGELGFTQLAKPANDPAYREQQADCHGQIRFGTNGRAAARTLSMLDPCLELVKTNRRDAGVDLVLGTEFRDLHLSNAAQKVLDKLKSWAAQHQDTAGGKQAAAAKPSIDPKLLHNARSGDC